MKLRTLNTLMIGLSLVGATGLWAAEAKKEKEAVKAADETTVSVSPEIRYIWVNGDENRFRQDWWMNDKLSGGIESLKLQRTLKDDWTLSLEGRALFDEHDYQVRLEILNPKIGFVRAGYTEFRKYFDDSGGYYKFVNPVAGAKFFALNQKLNMDISDLYVDVGLTLPNWPKITLGYERKAKDGDKSMVEWGGVQFPASGTTTNRNIYPAYKAIDDKVNLFKVDIEHDISNVHLADQFRYENYKTAALRLDDVGYVATNVAPGKVVTVHESYQHDSFMNTFAMDSHVNEKVYWSMGYLFQTLDGAPGFDMTTTVYPQYQGTPAGTDKFWAIREAALNSDSHVLNGNAFFGPFAKTYIYGGLQAEKTQVDSFADQNLREGGVGGKFLPEQALTNVREDKDLYEERLGVRFIGIPFTTLYAEAKWSQGNFVTAEDRFITGFTNSIASEAESAYKDADVSRQDYRIGFSTSPIAQANLSGYYRHNSRHNDYSGNMEETITRYTNGTVAVEEGVYMTDQKLRTDEFCAKLSIKPHAKLNVSFKYQFVTTKIQTQFEDPAAANESGDYQSSIYSVSATVTPINQLYLSGMFSYQDTRTIGQANGAPMVAIYHGDVISVTAAAGYAFDKKTDVQVDYTYSSAHNGQSSIALAGLPLGTDYERHGVTVALTRQIRDNIALRLRYGYYDLKDDAVAGNNDYSAHLLSGSCTIRF